MAKAFRCAAAVWLLWLVYATAGIAQQSGSPTPTTAPPLKIGPGDLIEVTMYENPDLSGSYRVDGKGDVVVPLAGRVHVAGATAEEAAVLIEKRYVDEQILQPGNSYATVFISEYATQGITVNGEVKDPGVYPALGVRMLNDVIAAAGGETPLAASEVTITHRDEPKEPITVDYNPEALHPVIPQVQVFPGDLVMVPKAGIVYVLGDVVKPGGFVLQGRQTLTVEEALALAGGGGHAAAMRRVQLVRTLADGRKEAITIPVDLIYKGRAPDVGLKDGDVVYVPTSTSKLVTEQAINSALSIGTGIVLYREAYATQ